jgi:hypothetical protein
MPPEDDEGDTEYKFKIVDCTMACIESRATQF